MRQIQYRSYGGPEVTGIAEVSEPTPRAGEVLVRVAAAGLNPVDALQRQGTMKVVQPLGLPQLAGNELSGVVAALGSGVTGVRVGERVMARVPSIGALAELVALPAEVLAPAPASLTLGDAAAIPLAGLTAQQALGPDHLDLSADDRLLVTGGAGGVGPFAIQLAKLAGAHVTTTASPAGRDLVTRMGADAVIDYRQQKVSEAGRTFTKVLDLVSGDSLLELFGVVEPGARVVSLSGPPSPGSLQGFVSGPKRLVVKSVEAVGSRKVRAAAKKAGASYEFFLMHADGPALAELSRLVDGGSLQVTIDSRFAMDDFAAAFERLESHRAKGKVLVELDPGLR